MKGNQTHPSSSPFYLYLGIWGLGWISAVAFVLVVEALGWR